MRRSHAFSSRVAVRRIRNCEKCIECSIDNAFFSYSNMSEEQVCDFAMSCLLHTDPEVRYSGMQLMKHMYQCVVARYQ